MLTVKQHKSKNNSSRSRKHLFPAGRIILLMALGALPSTSIAAPIDTFNNGATPDQFTNIIYTFDKIGWYYTPDFTYQLTRIESFFDPIPGSPVNATQPITIKLFDERPSEGGEKIAESTFAANKRSGGQQGVNFTPISLTVGYHYFLAFEGLNGMGVNLATWNYINGEQTLINGASQSFDAYYRDADYVTRITDRYQTASPSGNVSGTSPILYFYGNLLVPPTSPAAVPEPGILVLSCIGIGCMLLTHRRRNVDHTIGSAE